MQKIKRKESAVLALSNRQEADFEQEVELDDEWRKN